MENAPSRSYQKGALSAAGALMAGASVALLAYASHAGDGAAQDRLQTAGTIALVHGAAIAALSRAGSRRVASFAVLALAVGALLFSGSVAMSVVAQWPTTLAPAGGLLLIGGWLLWAVDAVRGRG
ncbi:MAG: DUF423 domain-containing protein [Pseudomonadota bacterium]|nr:DUF423 domain-containing protein [Pseudomonadota bacterium]